MGVAWRGMVAVREDPIVPMCTVEGRVVCEVRLRVWWALSCFSFDLLPLTRVVY